MTEDMLQVGSQHVHDVQDINKNLIEKTLRMRCLAYLSQVKSQLLIETIHDINFNRRELAHLSVNLEKRARIAEQQNKIIEQQKYNLDKQNKELEIERKLLELKVEERSEIHQQAKEILDRSQKMNSLGTLIGGIAHDYNNMLGIITGYAELLENALTDQPELEKYANQIHRAGERGAKLTRKLLNFSNKRSDEASITDINQLLLEVREILEKSLTSRIQLKLVLSDDLWPAWVDKGDLEDAIINLSMNALHAIEENGQLTIQTHNQQLNALDAHVLQLDKGDYVLLSISDTGCGMDNKIKEKIFEPFFSTKGDKGTGLGLSQVYGFVARCGGSIKVHSAPDQGSCFSLYFPRCYKKKPTEPTLESKDHTEKIFGNETILIVDDEPAMLELSYEILANKGYKIITTNGAEEAMKILEKQPVDLLLSDIIMPNINGYQLAAIASEKYPAMKIQLVSGFSEIHHKEQMLDDSLLKNIILKPYKAQQLLKKIHLLLHKT